MAWGDPGVSKKLRLSNGVQNWGTGGQPTSANIQPTGILEEIRMLTSGTTTATAGTGAINKDIWGYGNTYQWVTLSPNNQSPIVSVSGFGLQLVNYLKSQEYERFAAPESNILALLNAESAGDQYSFPTTSGTLRFPLNVPVAQRIRSLGGNVGMWPLQNPAITLQLAATPNSASTASPFNIYSTTATAAPYLVTNNATVTIASPSFEPIRTLWQVPNSEQDYPPFNLVSAWIEEQPQGAVVAGATQVNWLMTPLSGILCRIAMYIYDNNNSNGVAASNLAASNAIVLSYDANTPKFSESAYAALARQHGFYGADLPQGLYAYDLLGKDLTLQDTLNSHVIGNIKMTMNFGTALGSSAQAKVLKQVISPLTVK